MIYLLHHVQDQDTESYNEHVDVKEDTYRPTQRKQSKYYKRPDQPRRGGGGGKVLNCFVAPYQNVALITELTVMMIVRITLSMTLPSYLSLSRE